MKTITIELVDVNHILITATPMKLDDMVRGLGWAMGVTLKGNPDATTQILARFFEEANRCKVG